MSCSVLDNSYALFTACSGSGRSNRILSSFLLITMGFNVTINNPDVLHLHPLRMASWEIVCFKSPKSSSINTSSGANTVTYFASGNLLALSSEFRAKLGTMSTFLAGYRTLWCNFAFVLALVYSPVAISNTLCESSSVGINSSPSFPTVDVAPKSTTADVPLFSLLFPYCSLIRQYHRIILLSVHCWMVSNFST